MTSIPSRVCTFEVSKSLMNNSMGEGFESICQFAMERVSRKYPAVYLLHEHQRIGTTTQWRLLDPRMQETCTKLGLKRQEGVYFKQVYQLLNKHFIELALNGLPHYESCVKSTADLFVSDQMIKQLPFKLASNLKTVVYKSTIIRQLFTGSDVYDLGLLDLLGEVFDPKRETEMRAIFDNCQVSGARLDLYNKCISEYEYICKSFSNDKFQESVNSGRFVISAKTIAKSAEIASIADFPVSRVKDPFVALVMLVLRGGHLISSLTIAGPLLGFLLGLRSDNANIDNANGLFLPFELYSDWGVVSLTEMIQESQEITDVIDCSEVDVDEFTQIKYKLMLSGMFLRDMELNANQLKSFPNFRIKSSSGISFDSNILIDRPPLSRELLNNQLVPIIKLLPDETLDFNDFVVYHMQDTDKSLKRLQKIYLNGQESSMTVSWTSPQWYLHSSLNILDVTQLYDSQKKAHDPAKFPKVLSRIIKKNKETPGCKGLRQVFNSRFWEKYQSWFEPAADGTTLKQFVYNPRDWVVIDQYMLLKAGKTTASEVLSELTTQYPGAVQFRSLSSDSTNEQVLSVLKQAIDDPAFPEWTYDVSI